MYKLHLYDPDEDVSKYQQKMINQYLRNARDHPNHPEQNEIGHLSTTNPNGEPVDNNFHSDDSLRELHNELEAAYPSDDEMEISRDYPNFNAFENRASSEDLGLLESGIRGCERDTCDYISDEFYFSLNNELEEEAAANEATEAEVNGLFRKDYLKSFDDLLKDSSSYETIKGELNVNRAELFMMLMKYADKYDISHSGLSALISLINTMFKEAILPSSRYRLDKIFNSYSDATYHATCPECGEYLGNYKNLPNDSSCISCLKPVDCSKPSLKHMFSIVDPTRAISDFIHIHENYYDWVMNERVHEPGVILDVYDGYMWRRLRYEQLSPEDRSSFCTAILNADGAAPYQFSKSTVWPIYITINETPIQARLNHVIICGAWFGKKKPNLNVFLKPLIDILNRLSEEGLKVNIKGEERTIKVFTVICSVDTMCRCSMQGTRQCNGRFGCCWCTHPGSYDHFSKSRKYGILSRDVVDRDHEWVSRFMKLAANDPNWIPVFGIKEPSPLLQLKQFDVVRGFVVDYMHCCLIGVTKRLVELLLGAAEINELQKYMESIKLPTHVRRLTKPIIDRKFWNAKDYENFLLYFSMPLLALVCDETHVSYWALFVESMHILTSKRITYEQLQKADKLLRQFVFETETNFTISAMVYNIHMLLHIVRSVYDWGPLVPISTFAFESANHYAMKAIKNAKGATLQVQRYINNRHCIDVMEREVLPKASEPVKNFYKSVIQSQIQHATQMTGKITFLGSEGSVPPPIAASLQLSLNRKCYRRMVKDGCLYTSDLKNNRSDNSIAVLEQDTSKQYIEIQCFVIDNGEQYVLFKRLETEKHSLSEGLEQLQVIVSVVDHWEKASVHKVSTICAAFTINDVKYICSLPNLLSY